MLVGTKQGQVRRIQQTGQRGHWEGCAGRLVGWLLMVQEVGPRTRDESGRDREGGTNGFLTPLGTLRFGGQPHVSGPQARFRVGVYNYVPSLSRETYGRSGGACSVKWLRELAVGTGSGKLGMG